MQQHRARRQDVPHGVRHQHFPNPEDIGASIELARDVEQRIELIHLEGEVAVEPLELFVNTAVINRCRRGHRERFGKETVVFAIRLAAIAKEKHAHQALRFDQRYEKCGSVAVRTLLAQSGTLGSPTPQVSGLREGSGSSIEAHRSSLRPRRADATRRFFSPSESSTPAQAARVSPIATNSTRSRISGSSSERLSVELKSRSAKTSESFF